MFLKGSLTFRAWLRLGVAAVVLSLPGASLSGTGSAARAGDTLEQRKLPMRFAWHERAGFGGQLVAAVGTITSDTPKEFADFADGRDLKGVAMVLDSSGGSVLDAIKLGRQWRDLGVTTTVGIVTETQTADGTTSSIFSGAYCESMCVFLLLSGQTRTVPDGAHVRVHQIWMGDRADDAKAATYTAQDVMIIERDVGRLAKYTFDMGGTGDLLALALSVPPWEPLHELTPSELRLTNIVTDDAVAEVAPKGNALTALSAPAAEPAQTKSKPVQDRFIAGALSLDGKTLDDKPLDDKTAPIKSTKTAEAGAPTGAAAATRH
ncbi:hypothetical protein [Bradyrhizobium prioriisuperbiae]|uniref:COG3904 family protein n=1 Tax=Bradyrhizobium prioriisuperbiae TaxID=2854389 RepID=UPI0028E1E1A3|nr:hypothetical protein [Bradyrhizobium prioritasuperba]